MASLRWVILAERAIIEAQTSNLSLISILDEVRMKRPAPEVLAADKPPLVPNRFAIVQLWERSRADKREKISVRSKLMGPNGKTFATVEQTANLEDRSVCRIIGYAPGFPLLGEGIYPVEIYSSTTGKVWRKVARTQFKVIFTDGPAAVDVAKKPD